MLPNQFQNLRKLVKSVLAITNTRYFDGAGIASNLAQIWGVNLLTFLSSTSGVIVIGGVIIDLVVFILGFFVRFHSNFSLITFL